MRRLLLLLGLLSVAGLLLAQQTSGIVGTVTDPSQASVGGASVTIRNEDTGLTRNVTTSGGGNYAVPDLPVGTYEITVKKEGFDVSVSRHLKLDVERTARADFSLQVGALSQTVTVINAAPLLQTEQSQISTLIENRQILQLPLNGRNYLQLNLLVPGTSLGSSNADYVFSTHGDSAHSFSVNGMRSIYNGYLIDGVPTQEVADGAPALEPSLEAIHEFRVETSNTSAQFGSMAGGQINLVTKAGTNTFSGSAFDFLRNDDLDARNFFAPTKPSLKRNDFGGSVGGPISKNNTFFFASYEGLRLIEGLTQTGLVPTNSQRNGDLSNLLAGGIQLRNPVTGAPYANNQIPVNPIVSKFLSQYVPLPNYSGNSAFNYISTDPETINHDDYSGRLDHYFSQNDTIFARWLFENVQNNSAKFFPTDSYAINSAGQNAAVGYTHTFGPRAINELRLGYNRFWQNENNGRAGKTDVLGQLGIQGFCEDPQCWGEPAFNITGFAGLGEHGSGQVVSGPRRWGDEIYELNDAATYTRGNHIFKAGVTFDLYHDSFQEAIYPRGIYSFDGEFTSPTGSPNSSTSIADFLLGYPHSINASITKFVPYYSYRGVDPWIQDDWRMTSTLTLNLGLRYEWLGIPVSRYNNWASIDFSAKPAQLVTPNNAQQLRYPRNLVNNDNNNFAPRIGLAWSPANWKRSVFRAAYGMFYGRELINTWTDLSINPPFVQQSNVILNPSLLPNFTLSNPLALAATTPGFGTNYAIDPNFKQPYIQEWNASWQFQVSSNTQATVSYVGNKATRLPRLWDPNQAVPGPGPVPGRQPFPQFGTIGYIDSGSASNYNALQVQVEHRYSNGLSLLGSYTFGKCLDDSPGSYSGEGGIRFTDVRNFHLMKGLCSQNVANRFALSYVYDLPFGRGRRYGSNLTPVLAQAIGGWQVSGITTLSGGEPFTVTMPGDWANVGDGTTTPLLLSDPSLPGSKRSLKKFFNTAAFTAPPANQFGNAGRNIVIGPGLVDFDFALSRSFALWERSQLQFRAEAFNIANHPAFGGPGATYGTPNFGVITSAGEPRDLQMSLKLVF